LIPTSARGGGQFLANLEDDGLHIVTPRGLFVGKSRAGMPDMATNVASANSSMA